MMKMPGTSREEEVGREPKSRFKQSYIFGTLALACTTVLFLPCMLLAKLASHTRVNMTTVSDTGISKSRVWYSSLARIPGNLILGFRRAPVKVLSKKEFRAREQLLSKATVSNNALVMRKLDGVPLANYLAKAHSDIQKLAAIHAATSSLFDFHLQHDQSHGDASATNVMIMESGEGQISATWFDFDVAHKDSVPEVTRRADDLRALFFTSKPWLTDAEFAQLFADPNTPYADEDVWKELIKTMSNPFQHCDIFHLAQQLRAKASLNQSS